MELHERIASVRKAAGLTQEQLGEKLGVTRQAVSKWESNQATPDTATIARLCVELNVSADFILLGKEPEGSPSSAPPTTVTCPCCGKPAPAGTPRCQECAYDYYPVPADDERRYAVVLRGGSYAYEHLKAMEQFSGWSEEECRKGNAALQLFGADHKEHLLLRRGLSRSAALHIAGRMRVYSGVKVVADDPLPGHPETYADTATLEEAPEALETPEAILPNGKDEDKGLGFWGIVGAVLLALLIAALL